MVHDLVDLTWWAGARRRARRRSAVDPAVPACQAEWLEVTSRRNLPRRVAIAHSCDQELFQSELVTRRAMGGSELDHGEPLIWLEFLKAARHERRKEGRLSRCDLHTHFIIIALAAHRYSAGPIKAGEAHLS